MLRLAGRHLDGCADEVGAANAALVRFLLYLRSRAKRVYLLRGQEYAMPFETGGKDRIGFQRLARLGTIRNP